MNIQIRLLCLILTIACFVFGLTSSSAWSASQSKSQDGASRCTKEALAALKSIPKLNYECGDEQGEELRLSPIRRTALRALSRKLESSLGPSWWAAPVDDLNACGITHEPRALTKDERRDFDSELPTFGNLKSTSLMMNRRKSGGTPRSWCTMALSRRDSMSRLFQSQDRVAEAGSKFSRKTYVWNGSYYTVR